MKTLRFLGKSFFVLPLLAAAPLISSSSAQAAVWKSENQWSPQWEQKYRQWVKAEWDQKFFTRTDTPFFGLKLDCADAVYSMRLVFAYLNRLPFAMLDPTGGKKLITNDMSRFDNIADEGKRARAFLSYVFEIGSTASLPNDTYPTALNRDAISSGSLILTDRLSHHSWTIKEVLPNGIPHLIYSSRPAKNVMLVRVDQPSMEFTFKGKLDQTRHAGFRNFRRIEDLGKPVWQVEGASDEQYRIPYKTWRQVAKQRLSLVQESAESVLRRALDNACVNARERVAAVNEALAYLKTIPATSCMNASKYDDLSTPNRDLRLRNSFEDLIETFSGFKASPAEFATVPEALAREIEDVLSDAPITDSPALHTCAVQITPDKVLTLREIRSRSIGLKLSNNPYDPLEMRWGDRTGPSVRAQKCPSYE